MYILYIYAIAYAYVCIHLHISALTVMSQLSRRVIKMPDDNQQLSTSRYLNS